MEVGFSLVEMVLTLTLLSIIFGAGFRLFSSVSEAYFTAQGLAPVMSEGHLAMERMVHEIRHATTLGSSAWEDQGTLSFTSQDNKATTFYQSTSGGDEIMMNQGGVEGVLARNVQAGSLLFSWVALGEYYTFPRLATIEFTMNHGTRLRTAVHVRSP